MEAKKSAMEKSA